MLPRVTPLVAAQRAQPAGLADAAVRAQEAPPRRDRRRRLPGSSRWPGSAGLRASGHGRDQILLGETAPIGRTSGSLARRPIPPVEFLRKLFCLNASGRRLRGADGRAHGCRKFKRLAVKGFAHHPYQRGGSRPPAEPPQAAGEITISSPSRLRRVLDQAARARRIPRRLPVFYTEFGFQTNPPDRIFGVRVALQPGYINQSDWMAYRDRRVRAVAQYKLIDEAVAVELPVRPALPRRARQARLRRLPAADLGQRPRLAPARLRPGAPGAGLDAAGRPDPEPAAQRRAFTTVTTLTVRSRKGQFLTRVPKRAGVWRLQWNGLTSREARVAPR